MRIRIPSWTTGATVSVNGVKQNITTDPGSYATLSRSWTSGDTVTVRLPMRIVMRAANDNANVSAITYGPVVLSGNYGDSTLSSLPTLNTSSITRTSTSSLAFTATANGRSVTGRSRAVVAHGAQTVTPTGTQAIAATANSRSTARSSQVPVAPGAHHRHRQHQLTAGSSRAPLLRPYDRVAVGAGRCA